MAAINHTSITGAGTTVVKGTPGFLRRVIGGSNNATRTLTFYDNTAASGTILAVVTFPKDAPAVYVEYGIPFNIGLTVVQTGIGGNTTVVYE